MATERPVLDGVRILIVDDDDAIRMALRRILQNAGCVVIDARRPTDAISASREFPEQLDIALVDLLLPEMSGPECAEKLLEGRPDLAVGYMSGYLDMDTAGGAVEADLRIEKPFAADTLVDALRAVVVRRNLSRLANANADASY